MYALSELGELQFSRPAVDAPEAVVAAWHERRAVVLEHLSAENAGSAFAAGAAESAHRYAAQLIENGTTTIAA
ncbi:hypothetical protein ACQPXB_40770 [Amycolatopsis sp. CA-161197]|uniref:hypothetical protein n=1 Tax=Amycolatopsis sp. CA-161197 TaxID=3239922 RepID=UPI003D916288